MDIAIIISIVSLIVSIVNVLMYIKFTIKYNAMVSTQTLTAQGAFEAQIRSLISDATKEITHYAIELQHEPENSILQQAYFTAEEQYRNAYEEACGKYIDGKIDKVRFEKLYKQEIYKLVNDDNQKNFMQLINLHMPVPYQYIKNGLAKLNSNLGIKKVSRPTSKAGKSAVYAASRLSVYYSNSL